MSVYLQGCLAYKPCSAPGLHCRYLNPYIKLKLIGLAFSASSHVKANFLIRLFNVFFHFRSQSAKKRVFDLLYLISVKSVVFFSFWWGGWHFYSILVSIFYAAIFFISNIFTTQHGHHKLQITFIQYNTTYNTTTTNKY